MGNLVLAGNKDRAAQLATAAQASTHAELEQHERAPWALATHLAVLAANGELMPEAEAQAIMPTLLRYRLGVRQSYFGPNVSAEADNAIAELSFQVTHEQMETLLDIYELLIERAPAQWRPNDRGIVQVLIAAYRRYPDLADRAFSDLLDCLGRADIGGEALRAVSGLASEGVERRTRLIEVAEAGNAEAVVALCFARTPHRLVRQEARARYQRVMQLKPPMPGVPIAFLESFQIDALFARQLPARQRERLAHTSLGSPTDRPTLHRTGGRP